MSAGSHHDAHAHHGKLLTDLARRGISFGTLPLFSLEDEDRRRKHVLSYETEVSVNDEDGTFKWQVSADPSYGFPDAFDRKVYKTLETLALQQGLPLKNPIHFSLYQILQILGLPPFGVHFSRVRSSIQRIAAVKIHTHFLRSGGERAEIQSETFHIYDAVTFQEESFGNEIGAGNHQVTFGAWYLENLNGQYIRPVDLTYFAKLENPVSSRLHELLTLKFEQSFRNLEMGWRVLYTDLCQMIPIKEVGWMSSPQRQLESIHEVLIATDFLDRVEWTKTNQGWSILYVPGLQAREAHQTWIEAHEKTAGEISAVETTEAAPGEEPESLQNEMTATSLETEDTQEDAGAEDIHTEELDEETSGTALSQEEEPSASVDLEAEEEPELSLEVDGVREAPPPEDISRLVDILSDEPADPGISSATAAPSDYDEVVDQQEDEDAEVTHADSISETEVPSDYDEVVDQQEDEDAEVTQEGIPVGAIPAEQESIKPRLIDQLIENIEKEIEASRSLSPPRQEEVGEAETESPPEETPDEVLPAIDKPVTAVSTPSISRGVPMFEKNGEHSLCDITYHLAWTTKSRDHILTNEVALRSRQLIRDICAVHEARIVQGVVAPDHIHIKVACPPTVTPGSLVSDLKERTLDALLGEFPPLHKQYWGHSIWSVGYLCVTVGADTDAQLNQYLESQKPAGEEDEVFQVVPAQ